MTAHRWAVTLNGSEQHLSDWEQQLKPGFDPSWPWVEVETGSRVLHARAFEQFGSASEVEGYAANLVQQLSGAMRLRIGRTKVTAGHVVEYGPDGKKNFHVLVVAGVSARARVSAVGVAVGPDGNVRSSPPAPGPVQALWATMAADPLIAEALANLGGDQDWSNLYKVYDLLRLKYKSQPRGLEGKGWVDPKELERFSRTANSGPRHSKLKVTPHKRPMSLSEGRALMAKLVSLAIAEAAGPAPSGP